jgi:NAD(P)-dependent dehydrogenase (short-subunit alcohol dehydrogenase family)
MPGSIAGKVAIVTGGGSGFGFGIAEKFVNEGGKVLILDIAPGKAPELAARGVKFLKGDVSLRETWERALETCLREFGGVDIVVNNAGILIVKVLIPCVRYRISHITSKNPTYTWPLFSIFPIVNWCLFAACEVVCWGQADDS